MLSDASARSSVALGIICPHIYPGSGLCAVGIRDDAVGEHQRDILKIAAV